MNELPELGMPQVAAIVDGQGLRWSQRDLNVELLHDFLTHEPWPSRLADVLTRQARQYTPSRAPALPLPLPAKSIDENEEVRLWDELAVRAFDLVKPATRPADLLGELEEGHVVYDAFFRERLLARGGPPPAVIGLSIMSTSQLFPGLLLARAARERWPGCRVVIGGPWASNAGPLAERFLETFRCVDALVVGRGEVSMLAIARTLRRGRGWDVLPNAVVRTEAGIRRGPRLDPLSLDSLPAPRFEGLPLDLYSARTLPLQTTSRCEWGRCLFCYHDDPSLPLDRRQPVRVVDDVVALRRRFGVDSFCFADCATPLRTMAAIASELDRRGERAHWSALARAEAGYSPDLCRSLYASGCRSLLIGLETASKADLKRLRKGIDPERVAEVVRACGEAGIAVYLFLLDFPGNTTAKLEATFRLVLDLAPWLTDFIITRFQLSELSQMKACGDTFGIRRLVDPSQWLDVFDIPFEAEGWIPEVEYLSLVESYTRAFSAARRRPRQAPFLCGTLG